jgi:hypothetical protein
MPHSCTAGDGITECLRCDTATSNGLNLPCDAASIHGHGLIVTDQLRWAEAYLGIAGLACQLTLLAMQLRTYRKTRHSSLTILAIGSALAILYLVSGLTAALYARSVASVWGFTWLPRSRWSPRRSCLQSGVPRRCFARSRPATTGMARESVAPRHASPRHRHTVTIRGRTHLKRRLRWAKGARWPDCPGSGPVRHLRSYDGRDSRRDLAMVAG